MQQRQHVCHSGKVIKIGTTALAAATGSNNEGGSAGNNHGGSCASSRDVIYARDSNRIDSGGDVNDLVTEGQVRQRTQRQRANWRREHCWWRLKRERQTVTLAAECVGSSHGDDASNWNGSRRGDTMVQFISFPAGWRQQQEQQCWIQRHERAVSSKGNNAKSDCSGNSDKNRGSSQTLVFLKKRVHYTRVRKRVPTKVVCARFTRASRKSIVFSNDIHAMQLS